MSPFQPFEHLYFSLAEMLVCSFFSVILQFKVFLLDSVASEVADWWRRCLIAVGIFLNLSEV